VAGIDTKVHSLEDGEENGFYGDELDQVKEDMRAMEGKLDEVAELLVKLVGNSQLEEA